LRHHLYVVRSEHIHALSAKLIVRDRNAPAGPRSELCTVEPKIPDEFGLPRSFARSVGLQDW
jgi:hypothetical protein